MERIWLIDTLPRARYHIHSSSQSASHFLLDFSEPIFRILGFRTGVPCSLKSPAKADAKKVIDSLAGQWSLSFEEKGVKGTAVVTATPCTSEMVLRITYQEPGEAPANGLFAWHEAKKQIVETWFRNGEHVRICFDGLTEDGALIGLGEGMLEGQEFQDVRILKFDSPDHYTHTRRGAIIDGELQPEVVIDAERAPD